MNIRVTLRDHAGRAIETRVCPPETAGPFAADFLLTQATDPDGWDETIVAAEADREAAYEWSPRPGSIDFEPTAEHPTP